jgi:hypothetical protein
MIDMRLTVYSNCTQGGSFCDVFSSGSICSRKRARISQEHNNKQQETYLSRTSYPSSSSINLSFKISRPKEIIPASHETCPYSANVEARKPRDVNPTLHNSCTFLNIGRGLAQHLPVHSSFKPIPVSLKRRRHSAERHRPMRVLHK